VSAIDLDHLTIIGQFHALRERRARGGVVEIVGDVREVRATRQAARRRRLPDLMLKCVECGRRRSASG
jgi:hypothetical protein